MYNNLRLFVSLVSPLELFATVTEKHLQSRFHHVC